VKDPAGDLGQRKVDTSSPRQRALWRPSGEKLESQGLGEGTTNAPEFETEDFPEGEGTLST
jgi:hypothetical protein